MNRWVTLGIPLASNDVHYVGFLTTNVQENEAIVEGSPKDGHGSQGFPFNSEVAIVFVAYPLTMNVRIVCNAKDSPFYRLVHAFKIDRDCTFRDLEQASSK